MSKERIMTDDQLQALHDDIRDGVSMIVEKKHYYGLQAEINTLKTERNILAMLSADEPQFFNPKGLFEAKALRDRILKDTKL